MGCLFKICFKDKSVDTSRVATNEYSLFRDTQFNFITEGGNHFPEDSVTKEDFKRLKLLGRGTFGEVFLVKHIHNQKVYAMKILKKKLIKSHNQEVNTMTERLMLEKIKHPNLANLYYAFQDKKKLYLVTEFIQGGELFYHLYRLKTLDAKRAKFYIAQIVLGLEYLHLNNFIYRDLKPENILIGKDGYIKLTDFGLSKMFHSDDQTKTYTICGTPEYLAPEIVLNKGYDKTVDWWSFGVLLFTMLNGRTPLKISKTEIDIKQYSKPITFTNYCSEDARSILRKLLVLDPTQRLGYGPEGTQSVKSHDYFKDIDWEALAAKTIPAPFKPELKEDMDLRYFDNNFTGEKISETVNEKFNPSASVGEEGEKFVGFSYVKKIFEEEENENIEDHEIVIEKEG